MKPKSNKVIFVAINGARKPAFRRTSYSSIYDDPFSFLSKQFWEEEPSTVLPAGHRWLVNEFPIPPKM